MQSLKNSFAVFALLFLSNIGYSQKGSISRYSVEDLFTLDIYLPPGYDSTIAHKTIYLNDGESIFGFQRVFDSLLNTEAISPFIAVGIHAGEKRLDKYLPYDDPWIKNNWGDYHSFAGAYARVIIEGIIPFVSSRFNVISDQSGRAIFGYSFGGLHATWMGLKYPEVFSFIGALSPSYWVNDYKIFSESANNDSDQALWFDIGTAEWNYYIPMIEHLDTLGWNLGENLFYLEEPNGKHDFTSWQRRIKYPITLFCTKDRESEISGLSLEIACIPSQSNPGTVFKRVNPVVTLKNGVKYSAIGKVNYEIIKGKGVINEDGSFISNDPFKVSYSLDEIKGTKKVFCR